MKWLEFTDNAEGFSSRVEERATILGYLGLLPFVAGTILIWLTPRFFGSAFTGVFLYWELVYGAVILSFLGGIRWGFAIMDTKGISEYLSLERLTGSVLPPLIGWLLVVPASLLPSIPGALSLRFGILLIAFVYMMDSDMRASKEGTAPAWYGSLRLKITIWLSALLLLVILRMLQWGW